MCSRKDEDIILRLEQIEESLVIILERFSTIHSPEDFKLSFDGAMRLDSICMQLVVTGETINTIDRKTQKELLARYPSVDWNKIISLRNIIVHQYQQVDAYTIFNIVEKRIPALLPVIRQIISDIRLIGYEYDKKEKNK